MWTADEFIAMLNKEFGDMLHKYSFAQKVDFIRMGTCSSGFEHGHERDVSKESRDVPNHELYRQLTAECSEGSVILVLSECCGQYSDAFQSRVREMYPQYTWLLPHHDDFGEDMTLRDWERLADDLIEQNILSDGLPQEEK